MSTVQRIAKNTGVLLVSQIACYILSFFYMMYTARYLGAEGFGTLSFAIALTAIFGIFADLGLSALTVREVARDRSLASKYLANVSLMKVALSVITFGVMALVINLIGYPQQTINVVYLVGLSVVIGSFTALFYSVFQAFERLEFQSLGQVLNAAFMLVGVIVVREYGFSIVGFASLYLFAGVITLLYSLIISRWKFSKVTLWARQKVERNWSFWKDTIKQAWPFGLTLVFVSIYYWISSVMLSSMRGDEAVGWYNAAYRLIIVLLFIPGAYFSSVFPVMSRLHTSSKESLRFIYEKSFKYLFIMAIPIGVGTTLLANRVITLIFGAEYAQSIIALQILVWSTVFIFISVVFSQLFNSTNRQIIVTKVTGICALANVILNLVLITKYSYTGASVATVVTEFVALVCVFIWSSRIGYGIPRKNLINVISKVIVSSGVMCLFILHFKGLTLLALIPLSALLYFAVLYIIRGVDREDVFLLRSIIVRQGAKDASEVGGDAD